MKYIVANLKQVPPWRLIAAAVLLFGFSLESNTYLSYMGGPPSFQEMAVNSFDRIVVFSQYLIFLLVVADFGFRESENAKAQGSFVRGLGYLAFICLLFVLITMVFHLLVLLIKYGTIAANELWNAMALNGLAWVSPSLAMCLSVLYFFLRFLFVAAVIYAVNNRCTKIPYGFAVGIALFMLEMIVYYNLGPFEPTGILPFEHAYLAYALKLTAIPALDIIISAAYWGVLITAVGLINHVAAKPWRHKAKV